jgi:hypothetical protein
LRRRWRDVEDGFDAGLRRARLRPSQDLPRECNIYAPALPTIGGDLEEEL